MLIRIYTLIGAILMAGVPYFTSATNTGNVAVYMQWFSSPWKIALWVIWAIWMMMPLVGMLESQIPSKRCPPRP